MFKQKSTYTCLLKFEWHINSQSYKIFLRKKIYMVNHVPEEGTIHIVVLLEITTLVLCQEKPWHAGH